MNRQVRDHVGEALEVREIFSGEDATERMQNNKGNGNVSSNIAWPVMEARAFCGLAGELVRILEPHSEADPNGLLLQFLTAFGNAVGSSPYYLVEGDQHRAKLFVVTSGATSKGRKGTGWGRVRQVMKIADPAWESDQVQSGLSSGEGLISHVRDGVSKIGNDGEMEEIDPGVKDKRMMLITEEFSGALRVMERPGNTLSSVLRDAWGTAKLQTLTKNSPLKATDSHISIIGHVTDEELRSILSRIEMANGFANRFLFAKVRRSKLLPHGGNLKQAAIDELGRKVGARLQLARAIGRIIMTDGAAEAWERNYPALSAERSGLLGAVLGRAEAQVIRLAVIYALLENQAVIDLPQLAAALAVWGFCEDSATQIWGEMMGDDVTDTIMATLQAAGTTGMTRTEIGSLFSRHVSSARITRSLETLERAGKTERMPSGGHGQQRWRCPPWVAL
jgi:hypothetical protein